MWFPVREPAFFDGKQSTVTESQLLFVPLLNQSMTRLGTRRPSSSIPTNVGVSRLDTTSPMRMVPPSHRLRHVPKVKQPSTFSYATKDSSGMTTSRSPQL